MWPQLSTCANLFEQLAVAISREMPMTRAKWYGIFHQNLVSHQLLALDKPWRDY